MTLEIFADQRRVAVDGNDVQLGARAFDVLVYLVDHADRIVSKEELLTHVWAGRMVEESNLTVQIATLRKVLGREAIKTVPGIGYRYAPTQEDTAHPAAPPDAPPLPAIPSLAVMPFTNLTGSTDKDYLVDGIVNEIIGALSQLSSFFVISSTSSFTYKGRTVDLAEVGRELGVRYILEGSIQQGGDRLRIFTQLVEAQTGHSIWRDRFDGEIAEIFDLQDTVAARVAGALEPKMIWAESVRARQKPTENLTAYDLCLRATPMVFRLQAPEAVTEGMQILHRALALDPDYIHAHALVSYAHTSAFATRWWRFEQAQAGLPHARKVLDSDTDDALALAYAGHHVAYIGREYQEGLIALKRAVTLNPNSGTAAMLLGWVYNYLDDGEPAIEHLERAKRLSPLHPNIAIINGGIGCAYAQSGDFEKAVVCLEQAMAEYPEFASNRMILIGVYWALGRKDEAVKAAEVLRRKVPDMSVTTFVETRPQHSEFYRKLMVDALRATGFPD